MEAGPRNCKVCPPDGGKTATIPLDWAVKNSSPPSSGFDSTATMLESVSASESASSSMACGESSCPIVVSSVNTAVVFTSVPDNRTIGELSLIVTIVMLIFVTAMCIPSETVN